MNNVEQHTVSEQLLVRALRSPYIATSILSENVPVLLKDSIDTEIGYAVVRYYSTTKELLTENTLNSSIEQKIAMLNQRNARQGKEILDQSEVQKYFHRVHDLFSIEEDTNEKLESDINKYIHDELATFMISEEAQRGLDNLSQRVYKKMDKINDLSIGSSNVESLDFFNDTDKKTELYKKFKEDKVPFGIAPLDAVTRGGLEKGQVAMFSGSSGTGKSMFLSNLSYYFSVKSKKNVLHITLEEKSSDQTLRLDRIILNSGIENTFTLDGGIKDSFINKVKTVYPKVSDASHGALRIIKSSPNTITVDELRQLIISYTRKDNIKYDVVILDYADLLRMPTAGLGHESEMGQRLFQDLSKIAYETDTVLITGSQLNRGAGNVDVKTASDVEGSYRKINITALTCTLNTNDKEKNKGFFRLYLDKCRNSYGYSDKMIYLKYDLHSMKMHEDSDLEMATHKTLLGNDSSSDYREKKESKKKNLADAINASLN